MKNYFSPCEYNGYFINIERFENILEIFLVHFVDAFVRLFKK